MNAELTYYAIERSLPKLELVECGTTLLKDEEECDGTHPKLELLKCGIESGHYRRIEMTAMTQ